MAMMVMTTSISTRVKAFRLLRAIGHIPPRVTMPSHIALNFHCRKIWRKTPV